MVYLMVAGFPQVVVFVQGVSYLVLRTNRERTFMTTGTVNVSEEQLAKLIDAYKTIQEFLTSALSPNELYREEFLAGLRESDGDIRKKEMNEVRSFDDFTA